MQIAVVVELQVFFDSINVLSTVRLSGQTAAFVAI